MRISFTLNGEPCQVEVKPHQRLLDILRDDLRLAGTKEGCGVGECSAYTVTLDGRAVTSCLVPTPFVDGRNMITIEGMSCDEKLSPIQEAVLENHTLQCGFCTPGFIMSAKASLDENPGATGEEIRRAIFGNLCHCTGYEQLTDTICQTAGELKKLRMEKLQPAIRDRMGLMFAHNIKSGRYWNIGCEVKQTLNKMPKTEGKNLSIVSAVKVKKARTSHKSIPRYQVTPLADLKNVAEYLGLAKACVKDRGCRFRLSTFKVLDGSYAITRCITKETKRNVDQVPYSVLTSRELRDEFGQATFFSATDNSHGRGVTQAAGRLGRKCVIRMPVGSTENRRRHIEDEGAGCTIEKVNYDDYVEMVTREAKRAERGVVTQGTAWGDYGEIPSWVMQDYSTMADKTMGRFGERLIHVSVQTSVGSLAGGVVEYFINKYKEDPPVMIMMEAEPAACLYKGAETADGEIRIVDGEMPTIMTGLRCGKPSIASWDILKNHVTAFLAVSDGMTRRDIHMLAAPFKGDPQIISGESSTATFGALAAIMKDEACRGLHLEFGLDQDSKILMFSTKGDTDPNRYKTIV